MDDDDHLPTIILLAVNLLISFVISVSHSEMSSTEPAIDGSYAV
jgi:hypothetical protein